MAFVPSDGSYDYVMGMAEAIVNSTLSVNSIQLGGQVYEVFFRAGQALGFSVSPGSNNNNSSR